MDNHRQGPLAEQIVGRGLGPYRGYAEVLKELLQLADSGARLTLLGRSVRGEPLFALRLGFEQPTRYTRTSVVLSAVHPIEWIGIEVHLALLQRLVRADLGQREVVAVPIVNPDGVLKVERNLRLRRRRLVRHNARGVDLNRNFDSCWGRKSFITRLIPQLFRVGSHAASEPEVKGIVQLLSNRRVDRALSLHSCGGAVLYPSAHRLLPVADAPEHRRWAKHIAAQLSRGGYRALQCSVFAGGITQGGLELDWFHQRHGALSLLVECSRGGMIWRPSQLSDPFAWFNPPHFAEARQQLAATVEPFVRGAPIPDSSPPR